MKLVKKGKLITKYISIFDIIQCIGEATYELALQPGLSSVQLVSYFDVEEVPSRWCSRDSMASVLLDQNLTIQEEPVSIFDRQIQNLRSK